MVMTNEEVWKTVLGEMELITSKANFITWFKNTQIINRDNSTITISVPNIFVKEWLENKFNKNILQSVRSHCPEIKQITYIIGLPLVPAKKIPQPSYDLYLERQIKEGVDFYIDIDKDTNLNKKYTFESFVVGPNNELAHAASLAVSKGPGKIYNPLFLYGGVGLGKTHLLQAIGNQTLKNQKTRVLYMASERLVADIVSSIQNKTIEELKNKYSQIDILIVDDIQFIAGKTVTQDIFFSTFNGLYNKGKQIILSSDRSPKSIPALEERLRSRFEGGMIADIGIPDYETRLAILKTKSKEKNFTVSDKILSYIATNIQKNIRELEGALNKVIAMGQISNRDLTLNETEKLLNSYLNTPYKRVNAQDIIKVVSDFYGLQLYDLIKRSRKKEVVRPRQIAMYLLREETKFSFPEIGSKVGGRDHSTVMHAYEKIKKEEQEDEITKQELILIKERIYSQQ